MYLATFQKCKSYTVVGKFKSRGDYTHVNNDRRGKNEHQLFLGLVFAKRWYYNAKAIILTFVYDPWFKKKPLKHDYICTNPLLFINAKKLIAH